MSDIISGNEFEIRLTNNLILFRYNIYQNNYYLNIPEIICGKLSRGH